MKDRSGGALREQAKIVSRDSEIMSGELVFAGTHVEEKTLIDYLEAGHSVDDFGGHSAAGEDHRVRRSKISRLSG